jgi:hypothetical protein
MPPLVSDDSVTGEILLADADPGAEDGMKQGNFSVPGWIFLRGKFSPEDDPFGHER